MKEKLFKSTVLCVFFLIVLMLPAYAEEYQEPTIRGRSHVQNIGWTSFSSGDIGSVIETGTTGQSLRMEALQLKISGADVSIEYCAHVQDIGWQDWVDSTDTDSYAGTTGQSKRVEAVKIQLAGNDSHLYDIYYRTHIQDYGWMGWTLNGAPSGSEGLSKRMEALQIVIVNKDADAPGSTQTPFLPEPVKKELTLRYEAHVANIGWQDWVKNGEIAGTTGRALKMEALKIEIANNDIGGSIDYRTYVKNRGWQDWSENGKLSGTTGCSLQMEAIQIKLSGEISSIYDVYYRTHVSNIGWMGWSKNSESSGTTGYSYQIEAVEIQLVAKDGNAPGSTENVYKEKPIVQYQAHVANIGWQDWVENGDTAGTTGRGLQLEALKIKLTNNKVNGNITYRAHVANKDWQDWISEGEIAGTTGRALGMKAVEIKLTGELEQQYDVYYRAHVSNIGWMGWAKNGATSGVTSRSKRIEAIEIQLVIKGQSAPGSTANAYVEDKTVVYAGDLGVDVSEWNGNINWIAVRNSGVKFAFLRCAWGWEGTFGQGYRAGAIDENFEVNYSGARNADIPIGVYLYSYALNTNEASKEADFALKILNGRSLDLPVVYDVEDRSQKGLSRSEITDMIVTFCNKIRSAGYTPMVYSYYWFLYNKVDFNRINDCYVWLAHHNSTTDFSKRYEFWQYTSSGYINGIGGVDLNRAIINY